MPPARCSSGSNCSPIGRLASCPRPTYAARWPTRRARSILGVHLNLDARPAAYRRPLSAAVARRRRLFSRRRWVVFVGSAAFRPRRVSGSAKSFSSRCKCCSITGLQPTHLNGHQYIEMLPALSEIVTELLGSFGIKVIRVGARTAAVGGRPCGAESRCPSACLPRSKQSYARSFRQRMDRLGISLSRRLLWNHARRDASTSACCGCSYAGRTSTAW